MEQLKEQHSNDRFALVHAEFAVKRKMLYKELTAEQSQLFTTILEKIQAVLKRHNVTACGEQQGFFERLFQVHTSFKPLMLKTDIETDLDYKTLAKHYHEVADLGQPNASHSAYCLNAITLMGYRSCYLPSSCMKFFTSDAPAYGYRRIRQLVALHIFLHHICAAEYGSDFTFERLARDKCSEIYREQNAICELNRPEICNDLFVEQNQVCAGMFGFKEFLTLRNAMEVAALNYTGPCNCSIDLRLQPLHCPCHNHIDNSALVYFLSILTYFL